MGRVDAQEHWSAISGWLALPIGDSPKAARRGPSDQREAEGSSAAQIQDGNPARSLTCCLTTAGRLALGIDTPRAGCVRYLNIGAGQQVVRLRQQGGRVMAEAIRRDRHWWFEDSDGAWHRWNRSSKIEVKVEPGVTLREYLSHRPVALILDQGIAVPPEQVRSMESLLVFGSACTVSSAERVFPSDGRYSTAQPRCGWPSRRTLTHYPD